jgi:RHS repeat-associated protein
MGCLKLPYNQGQEGLEASVVFLGVDLEKKGKQQFFRIDYYPFGLTAKSYTRSAADPTKYLYNGGVEQNDYTSYYETFYRNYDASIGRFMGVDIKAASFSSQTPYQYAFNDPVSLNDPLGDAPMGDLYDHSYDDPKARDGAGFGYMDGKGTSYRYGGYGRVRNNADYGTSFNSMLYEAYDNSTVDQAVTTHFVNGHSVGTTNIDMSLFDPDNENSVVNREDYWIYDGNTIIGGKSELDYSVSSNRAVFDSKRFLGDYILGIDLHQNVTRRFYRQLDYTEHFFSKAAANIEALAAEEGWSAYKLRKAKYAFFASQVDTGKDFDLKRTGGGFSFAEIGRHAIFEGQKYQFDDFGNMNYGFAARAFGLTLFEGLGGAGFNQAIQKGDPHFDNPFGFFDFKRDSKMIVKGFYFKLP